MWILDQVQNDGLVLHRLDYRIRENDGGFHRGICQGRGYDAALKPAWWPALCGFWIKSRMTVLVPCQLDSRLSENEGGFCRCHIVECRV